LFVLAKALVLVLVPAVPVQVLRFFGSHPYLQKNLPGVVLPLTVVSGLLQPDLALAPSLSSF
jgi:hypothetical protein